MNRNLSKKLLSIGLTCLVSLSSWAQLLKVDINSTARSDNTAPGYQAWNLATDLGSTGQKATRIFTNAAGIGISCTVSQTVPAYGTANTSLIANWGNKDGNSTSTDPNSGYRLSTDGVWTYNTALGIPYTNGGAFCLVLSNLSAGVHTITTYHNDVYGNHVGTTWHGTNHFMSGCVISVDGSTVLTSTPSYYATNDSQCGFAYFSINAVAGLPTVINFDPDHTSTNNLDFVILNGFVIDGLSPGTAATGAIPGDGDEHVFANNDAAVPGSAGTGYTTLSWTPSQFAVTNDVYFGTVSNNVAIATHASPEFMGSYATNFWNTATNLNSALTYYWRIDEIDATNGVTKGDIWMFRTRHMAFPTAEGYGRFARGGRGGVVIEVTNLLDYDETIGEPVIPGSYRAAIEATGPRTIVFRVSGLIRLKQPCVINSTNGYVTIAGQTAPGDGICLSQYRAGLTSCSDVIMRFIRCRLGDYSQEAMDGIGLGNSNNSIIDHCSLGWTIDEASSSRQSGAVGSASANITFQHNIISEALDYSYHYNDDERAEDGCTNCYQPHAFAASISGEIGSYHHNLIAHCTQRNWSLAGGLDQSAHYAGSLDVRDNVVYNWLDKTTDGGVARLNYENNYYKPLPINPYKTWLLQLDALNPAYGTEQVYMNGNVMEGKNYDTNNWQYGTAVSLKYNDTNAYNSVRANSELYPSYVTTQTAHDAFKFVLSDVGCNLPTPDVIDQRVIGEVLNGTWHYIGTNGPNYTINGLLQTNSVGPNYPGFIDTQTDVHDVATNSPNYPWPPYNTYNADIDSDHDGLPDWWEVLHGTNPNSPPGDFSDANADPDGDGYSNLEDYLNWLAAPHETCAQDSYADLDLSQYAVGFTNQPAFAVVSAANGTAAVLADGKTARYTPTPGFNGLGSFTFSVTDTEGTALTNTVGVHVTPSVTSTASDPYVTWQLQYFGCTNLAVCPQASGDADPLGKGMSNTNQFLAGLNPTNPASLFRITSIANGTADVRVAWTTAGGHTNIVQVTGGNVTGGYATNSFADIPASLTILPGSGDLSTNYVDSGAATNVPSRYYRVRLVP
ncbi:MAG TPA: Ig-like domain-containing protein [Verrucomicrobiae bacterium]|nr:Ig-like domain-containing protein [Verrucomicrobiae bacterium]